MFKIMHNFSVKASISTLTLNVYEYVENKISENSERYSQVNVH